MGKICLKKPGDCFSDCILIPCTFYVESGTGSNFVASCCAASHASPANQSILQEDLLSSTTEEVMLQVRVKCCCSLTITLSI